MYQKAIDIPLRPVNLVHTVGALLQRLRKAASSRKDLGRDEDVAALEARLPDCGADFSFIAIKLRRVDVAVADLQRRGARFDALGRGGSVDAEAQTRDLGGAFGHMQLVGDGEFGGHCGMTRQWDSWDQVSNMVESRGEGRLLLRLRSPFATKKVVMQ